MEQFNLSLGAHLLLWVFPLALVILVFVENFLDGPDAGACTDDTPRLFHRHHRRRGDGPLPRRAARDRLAGRAADPRRRGFPPRRPLARRLVRRHLLHRQFRIGVGHAGRGRHDLHPRRLRPVVRAGLSARLPGQRLRGGAAAAPTVRNAGLGHPDRRHHPPLGRPAQRPQGHRHHDHPGLHDGLCRGPDDRRRQGLFVVPRARGPHRLPARDHHRRCRHHPRHLPRRFSRRRLDRSLPGAPGGRGPDRSAALCRDAPRRLRRAGPGSGRRSVPTS